MTVMMIRVMVIRIVIIITIMIMMIIIIIITIMPGRSYFAGSTDAVSQRLMALEQLGQLEWKDLGQLVEAVTATQDVAKQKALDTLLVGLGEKVRQRACKEWNLPVGPFIFHGGHDNDDDVTHCTCEKRGVGGALVHLPPFGISQRWPLCVHWMYGW
jgi:hypothetical protein